MLTRPLPVWQPASHHQCSQSVRQRYSAGPLAVVESDVVVVSFCFVAAPPLHAIIRLHSVEGAMDLPCYRGVADDENIGERNVIQRQSTLAGLGWMSGKVSVRCWLLSTGLTVGRVHTFP